MKKSALLSVLSLASALTLVACNAKTQTVSMTGCYAISDYGEIAAMGWITEVNYSLETYSDNTYVLTITTDMFGGAAQGSELDEGTVYETKGKRTVITTGSYTEAAAADESTTHRDLSLSAATRVYVAQYGKAWGRNTDIIGSTTMLDTANWTETMETIYGDTDENGNALNNGKEKLLSSDYAKAKTATIENPSLDENDTTSSYRLVSIPTVVA